MSRIDADIYLRSHPMRAAYLDGKLDLCEEIKDLVQVIMVRNNISPFKPTTEFEEGQVAALSAIIEACIAIEENADNQSTADVQFDA